MMLVNYTPWPHLAFDRHHHDGSTLRVVCAQGTFSLDATGPMRPAVEQLPLAVTERYREGERTSSLSRDTALATFKPTSDIHLDAVAWAPNGRASASWPVRVRVGDVCRDLSVRGPHVWRHRAVTGWGLTEPAPCLRVPLTYERAFGGSHLIDGVLVEEEQNPVGTGFLPRGVSTRDPIDAPQVVATDEPIHRAGQRYRPRGVAPLPAFFEPRASRAGTCDEAWLKSQWPLIPRDFDYAYFNSAHPDLVHPGYLRGDERVELVNLRPGGGSYLTELPGFCVFALARRGTRLAAVRLQLDTVHFELAGESPADHRALLCWRVVLPASETIDRLELRMVRLDEVGTPASKAA